MSENIFPNQKDYLQLASIPSDYNPPFLEHLFGKIDLHLKNGGKVLVLALTKKSSEEIANFLVSKGYKTFYLHSEIDTLDRWEIIKKLKTGEIDILVGVNLLREGIDLPEVSLIAILDADKEGFLRSTTSLIQIIGRGARNPNSEVILYAEKYTESMIKSLWETYRRRYIQMTHNKKHGIEPKQATSNIKDLTSVKTDENLYVPQVTKQGGVKRLKRLTLKEKDMIAKDLRKQLDEAIAKWEFERAAVIRDQLKELEGENGQS